MNALILSIFTSVFVNNIVLTRLLGIEPLLKANSQKESIKTSLALILILVIVNGMTWYAQNYFMTVFHQEHLQLLIFMVIIIAVSKFSRQLLPEPLINHKGFTINCAVLGISILSVRNYDSLGDCLVFAAGSGVGFLAVSQIMSEITERLLFSSVPESLKGTPITVIVLGLISLAFAGFTGLAK